MSENVIKAIVEECLGKLVKRYEKYNVEFLTESDVVSSLFCMLKAEMKKRSLEEFKVHSELRPYIEQKNANLVIKAKGSSLLNWKKHEPKNSGSVIDIVIVNTNQRYFEQAKKLSPEKYWRLVTYPLEAFAVCIEVKIRVSGNIRRIKKDIEKLCIIKEKKKDCLVYLLVLDRNACNLKNVYDYSHKKGVPLHCFPKAELKL